MKIAARIRNCGGQMPKHRGRGDDPIPLRFEKTIPQVFERDNCVDPPCPGYAKTLQKMPSAGLLIEVDLFL